MYVFQLDDWVLCRIYRKKQIGKAYYTEQKLEDSSPRIDATASNNIVNEGQMLKFPKTSSISHQFDLEYLGPITQLLSENSYNSNYDFQNMLVSSGIGQAQKSQFCETSYQNINSGNLQVTQSDIFNPSNYMNPVDDYTH